MLALVFPFVAARGASLGNTSHVMFSVFTFLFAVGLGLLARGLLARCLILYGSGQIAPTRCR